jgi:hypothetical protein
MVRFRLPGLLFVLTLCLVPVWAETLYFEKIELDGAYHFAGRFAVEARNLATLDAYAVTLDKAGGLTEVAYYRRGRNMPDPVFHASRIQITNDGEFEVRTWLNSRGLKVAGVDGIARQRLKKNEAGFYVNLFQYDLAGNLKEDAAGVSAYLWIPDAQGQRKRSLRLDKGGNRTADRNGVWEVESRYDPQGNLVEARFLDATGAPMEGNNGVAGYSWLYDSDANPVAETRLDTEHSNCSDYQGISRITWAYDKRGRATDTAFWDLQGRAVPDGSGVARYKTDWNDRLHSVKVSRLDTEDQLVLDDNGIALSKDIWYDQTNELETRTYGLALNVYYDGLSLAQKEAEERYLLKDDFRGIAVTRHSFDPDGNEVELKTWTSDLLPAPDEMGVPVIKRQFNNQGLVVEEAYFASPGLALENRSGTATTRWEYARGNMARRHNFGLGSALKEDSFGVATYQWAYDSRGMQIQQTNLGTLAQIKEDIQGVAIYRWKYDKYGNLLEESHFGIDEKATEDLSGASIKRFRVGPGGSRLLEARFDKNGKLLGN